MREKEKHVTLVYNNITLTRKRERKILTFSFFLKLRILMEEINENIFRRTKNYF